MSRQNLVALIEKHVALSAARTTKSRLSMEEKVELLRRSTTIEPDTSHGAVRPGSAAVVYAISVYLPSAQSAADVANDIAGAFIDTHLKMRSRQARLTTEFLRARARPGRGGPRQAGERDHDLQAAVPGRAARRAADQPCPPRPTPAAAPIAGAPDRRGRDALDDDRDDYARRQQSGGAAEEPAHPLSGALRDLHPRASERRGGRAPDRGARARGRLAARRIVRTGLPRIDDRRAAASARGDGGRVRGPRSAGGLHAEAAGGAGCPRAARRDPAREPQGVPAQGEPGRAGGGRRVSAAGRAGDDPRQGGAAGPIRTTRRSNTSSSASSGAC